MPTATIPIPIGGSYSAGDASTIPDGYVRTMRNYLARPNRWDGRPPFVYDTLMSVMGLARWEDITNQRTSTMAFDATKIYKKPTTGLAWDAGTSATFGTRFTDSANIYGTMYSMFDDGAGLPTAALSYDGTNISAAPFNTTLFSRTVTAFIDRLFLAYPRVTVTPKTGVTTIARIVYGDIPATLGWGLVNVTREIIVIDGKTTVKLYPTSTTASSIYCLGNLGVGGSNIGIVSIAATATNRDVVWRSDLQSTSASYDMPLTFEVYIVNSFVALAVHAVGDVLNDGVNLQRVTTAGTSGAGAPVWATTVGATTADGTVTWTVEGTPVISSSETYLLNKTTNPDWQTFYIPARAPITNNSAGVNLGFRIKFYNTSTPTITLVAVNFSFRDALTDGDPAKKNYGQQVTAGDFYFPFANIETATSATIDLDQVIWSDTGKPKSIRAQNTFPLVEVPGLPTAAAVLSNRYVVFKRKGIWIFAATGDKNEPILPESACNEEIGCIGPRALDKFRKELFFIGEDECYRMKIGEDPIPFCGVGMREEIMSKGSGWVEIQTTYKQPLLAIDRANKEVWVYTQAGKIYVFNLESETWSYIDVSGAPPVRSMIFDTIGQRMLVSFGGFGVTRHMESSDAADTIDNTATPLTITNDIVPKTLELFAPRYEASTEDTGVFHNATAAQGTQTLSVAYSYDRGTTFTTPPGYPLTVNLNSPRVRMPFASTGPSVTLRFRRVGLGGARNWSISKIDATLKVHRGEIPYANSVTA